MSYREGRWDDGMMGRWEDARMGGWEDEDGTMGRWDDWKMGRCRNGRMGRWNIEFICLLTCLPAKMTVIPIIQLPDRLTPAIQQQKKEQLQTKPEGERGREGGRVFDDRELLIYGVGGWLFLDLNYGPRCG